MKAYREGRGVGALSTELFWRLWEAPRPVGAVLLVHGMGEHSGRYDAFARVLAEAGITSFAFDLRGHGRSQGPRGDVDAFPRLLEDLLAMEEEMGRQLPPGLPPFLLGHSLGGLICIRRLQVFKGPWAGVVISAPWMATALPNWLRGVGRFLGMAVPGLSLPAGLKPDRLTRDPEMILAWRRDPLIHTRITSRFFRATEREQGKALSSRFPPDLPILFLVPGEDRVVRSQVTLGFARGIAGDRTRVEILEGRRHEPLNDVGREEVYGMVVDWLGTQIQTR